MILFAMDFPRVLKTLVVTNIFVQLLLLPHGKCCQFSSEIFKKSSNAGRVSVELYKTRQVRHTCGECASICLKERVSPWMCGAYSCLPLELTCELYAVRTANATPQNINLYLFQVTDVFHPMFINGHSYSIYLSSVTKIYQDAKTHCENMDSHLFHFDSLEDYEAIKMITFGHNIVRSYVGANDIAVEGTWVSDRDGTVIDTNVWLWRYGEPDNSLGAEQCVGLYHLENALADIRCSRFEKFLCKRDY